MKLDEIGHALEQQHSRQKISFYEGYQKDKNESFKQCEAIMHQILE